MNISELRDADVREAFRGQTCVGTRMLRMSGAGKRYTIGIEFGGRVYEYKSAVCTVALGACANVEFFNQADGNGFILPTCVESRPICEAETLEAALAEKRLIDAEVYALALRVFTAGTIVSVKTHGGIAGFMGGIVNGEGAVILEHGECRWYRLEELEPWSTASHGSIPQWVSRRMGIVD